MCARGCRSSNDTDREGPAALWRRGNVPMQSSEEILRRLAIGDRKLIAALAGSGDEALEAVRLDELTEALVRVAVLVPLDAPQPLYQATVQGAMRAGAS